MLLARSLPAISAPVLPLVRQSTRRQLPWVEHAHGRVRVLRAGTISNGYPAGSTITRKTSKASDRLPGPFRLQMRRTRAVVLFQVVLHHWELFPNRAACT